MRHTFRTYERLKRTQHIDTLFRTGKVYAVFPLKVIFDFTSRPDTTTSPVLAAFSVPKKKFRKATGRNRIRRQLRETWRTRKHILYPLLPSDRRLHVFFIFTGTTPPAYHVLTKAMEKAVDHLAAHCQT